MPRDKKPNYGVRRRGEKWVARPFVPGRGHVWAGTYETKAEAHEAGRKAHERYRRLPSRLETVESYASHWLIDNPRPKESTNRHYAEMSKIFTNEYGPKRLADISRLDAKRFAREHRGAARSVRAMFSDAMDDGLIEVNPFANLRMPQSRGRKDLEVLGEPEIARLVEVAKREHPNHGFWRMVQFAAYTGMRPSEIYGLEWRDVNFDDEEIEVRRQLYRRRCTVPKNGRSRTIILPPPAAEALKGLAKFSPVRMEDEQGHERDLDLVFRNKERGPMSQTALHGAWTPVRAAFGRSDFDFYGLRHTCATLLLEKGCSAEDVAEQLGHTDNGILVLSVYGHPSKARARERLKRAFKVNVREIDSGDEAANG